MTTYRPAIAFSKTPDAVPGADSRSARRYLFVPVMIGFAMLAAICASGVVIPVAWQYIPFAISLVALGLPHGSMDHLVPAWLDRRSQTVGSIARVVVLYAVLAGITALLWLWTPVAAALGFVALTWFHWGQGDLYVLVAMNNSRYLSTRFLRASAVLVRGGLPMLVPLLFHPNMFRSVLDSTVGLFRTDAPGLEWLTGPTLRTVLAVTFGCVLLVVAAIAKTRCADAQDHRAWWRDQSEVAVLLAFFALVPPILAVGLYFSLWHALRHFVRLGHIGTDVARPTAARALSLARACIPTTLAALLMLAAMALAAPGALDSSGAALGVYLVLISALTVPHVVIVTYMDRRQHVWRTV